MRRILAGLLTFLVLTATLLVLPVYAAPVPAPEPVSTSSDEVPMGSVEDPAPAADVQPGPTDPVAGVPSSAPTLTVSRPEVAEFSLVGVTWAADPDVDDTVVQVRVRTDDGDWGGWTEVTPETADQSTTARTGAVLRGGTSPLWTGPSTGVEVELVTRSGAQPTDVQLDLIDPGASEADADLGIPDITDTANAAVTMPAVFSRAQWGADEGIRTWAPQYAATIKAATLHHTADSNNYTADQVPQIMRSIYRYHTVSLGWGDIGYNVIVDKFGRLFEGRAGGLASTVMGAHAGGFNTSTFGVSMLGNYDLVEVPQATVDSVAAIIAWKFSLFGINPKGTTVLTSSGGGTSKYASGTQVTLPTIFAHRQVGSTVCPGRYGYARLPEIRDKVVSLSGSQTPITDRYRADAALRTTLGAATTGEWSTGDGRGHYQNFVNGSLYWSPTTGVRLVTGPIQKRWSELGFEGSSLGFPTSDVLPTGGRDGTYQTFQNGAMYWSPTRGVKAIEGEIYRRFAAQGYEGGPLGWPTMDTSPTAGGVGRWQSFAGGTVYWSPTSGARVMNGPIYDRFLRTGYEGGPLGWPTSDVLPTGGRDGTYQTYQNGAVYWSPSRGAKAVEGGIFERWAAQGHETGPLGWPTIDTSPTAGGVGRWQSFTGGTVYWSAASGARVMSGPIYDRFVRTGYEGGRLGWPTSDVLPTGGRDGTYQTYQRGAVYWSPGRGALAIEGAVLQRWAAQGHETGPLGWPTGDSLPTEGDSGLWQPFRGGTVYWSPASGARVMSGPIYDRFVRTGWEKGPLGWPTSDVLPTGGRDGTYQTYQNGAVYWSPSRGAAAIQGPVLQRWAAQGHENGPLGWPTGDTLRTGGGEGLHQRFDKGSIYWSAASGARALVGPMATAFTAQGWEAGPLGYPTAEAVPTGPRTGTYQNFQRGALYSSPGTGTFPVTGATYDLYRSLGFEGSPLGYPTAAAVATATGSRQAFQGGEVHVAGGVARAVMGPVYDRWQATGGSTGPLGEPTSTQLPTSGRTGVYNLFEDGAVYWSAATGAHAMVGPVHSTWVGLGWEGSRLGWPTRGAYAVPGGLRTDFQGGSITVATATGAVTVAYT